MTLHTLLVSITISIQGHECEREAMMRYDFEPSERGRRTVFGEQIDPDVPAGVTLREIEIAFPPENPIVHINLAKLLTQAAIEAIEADIVAMETL